MMRVAVRRTVEGVISRTWAFPREATTNPSIGWGKGRTWAAVESLNPASLYANSVMASVYKLKKLVKLRLKLELKVFWY